MSKERYDDIQRLIQSELLDDWQFSVELTAYLLTITTDKRKLREMVTRLKKAKQLKESVTDK